ncbi:hypothetical protein QWY97_18735 [Vibrio cortegadensis]|uniref:hypothetical protein n=1 Tax=Vibrio cortegadensis TaxID=1328770 RepID=UPI0021C3B51B|nr:hypothetical protein [Vibrio cortegadensis]MDN3699358.1 hypothetical protein [Vibrio cortegadensis]
MNWVSEIFKNVTVSKTLTGACCITGLALLITPTIFPNILEPLPKAWATVVLGVTVFSGCLQVFWGLSYSKIAILALLSDKAQKARSKNLSKLELSLINQLGEVVDEWWDIRNINYSSAPFTKLEILEACRVLEGKGLLKINSFHETKVRLSSNGRIKALELQKESAVSN